MLEFLKIMAIRKMCEILNSIRKWLWPEKRKKWLEFWALEDW